MAKRNKSISRKRAKTNETKRLISEIKALKLLIFGFSAHGAVVTWTNLVGGKWSNPANWDPNGVPGPLDDVIITNNPIFGQPVELDVNATIQSLAIGGQG